MAPSPLKLTNAILSILVPLLIILLWHTQHILSIDTEDEEVYVLDNPIPNFRSRSRFLANIIKKGMQCNVNTYNICNGVSANNGTSLLYCCKKHCRNIRGDRNNCGQCENKCKFGELCCNGTCVNVAYNANHCGKCNHKCADGVACNYGSCGYA